MFASNTYNGTDATTKISIRFCITTLLDVSRSENRCILLLAQKAIFRSSKLQVTGVKCALIYISKNLSIMRAHGITLNKAQSYVYWPPRSRKTVSTFNECCRDFFDNFSLTVNCCVYLLKTELQIKSGIVVTLVKEKKFCQN